MALFFKLGIYFRKYQTQVGRCIDTKDISACVEKFKFMGLHKDMYCKTVCQKAVTLLILTMFSFSVSGQESEESTEKRTYSGFGLGAGIYVGFDEVDMIDSLSFDASGAPIVKNEQDATGGLVFSYARRSFDCSIFGSICKSGPFFGMLTNDFSFPLGTIAGWSFSRGGKYSIGFGYGTRKNVKHLVGSAAENNLRLAKEDLSGGLIVLHIRLD